jgi:hypothetical protein
MHSALGILESTSNPKTQELSKQLDLYNQLIQGRLYGSVGMSQAEPEAEEYEEDSVEE